MTAEEALHLLSEIPASLFIHFFGFTKVRKSLNTSSICVSFSMSISVFVTTALFSWHCMFHQDKQLQSHAAMLHSFQQDLTALQQEASESRKTKARELEEMRQREEYLQYEVRLSGSHNTVTNLQMLKMSFKTTWIAEKFGEIKKTKCIAWEYMGWYSSNTS